MGSDEEDKSKQPRSSSDSDDDLTIDYWKTEHSEGVVAYLVMVENGSKAR